MDSTRPSRSPTARNPIDVSYPLGYALFDRFYDLLGGSPDEFQLRLPAALAGWACIPLTVWALRPLLGSRAAAVAALFVAASPWHLYWSQNARFYTLVQALGLFGGGLILRGIDGKGMRAVLGGAACLAVGALVHPTEALLGAGLVLGPLGLMALGRWPAPAPDRRARLTLLVLLGVALLGGVFWIADVLGAWGELHANSTLRHLTLSLGYLVSPLLGLGAVLGAGLALRGRPMRARILLAVVLVGMGAAFLASLRFRVSAQYVFVYLPWLAGLAAVPFAAAWSPESPESPESPGSSRAPRPPLLAQAYLAVLLVPLAVETVLYFGWRNGDRPYWREAYAYVFDHRDEEDLLLGMQSPVAEYYLAPQSQQLRHWTWIAQYDMFRTYMPAKWSRYGRRAWMVLNMEQLQEWPRDQRAELMRLLDEQATLETSFEVPLTPRDLDVRVYSWRGLGP